MILLNEEHKLNTHTLKRWDATYRIMLRDSLNVMEQRGEKLDITPIHHRLAPEGMRHEIQKRALRIESLMADPNWHEDAKLLTRIYEECKDVVNYAAFLGTFTALLQEDLDEAQRT